MIKTYHIHYFTTFDNRLIDRLRMRSCFMFIILRNFILNQKTSQAYHYLPVYQKLQVTETDF